MLVKMRYWNLGMTTATRIKLQDGKPLTIYHTENSYWKVFSYENRFIEEMRAEQEKKEEIARKIYEKEQEELARKIYEEKQQELARKKYEEEAERESAFETASSDSDTSQNISRSDYDTPPHIILDYTYAKEIYPKLISKYVSLLKPYKKSINTVVQ